MPFGEGAGLIDALVDAAHLALGDLVHQAHVDQTSDVVVDPLRRLAEPQGDRRARARLGQLAQNLNGLRLEQSLSLIDLLQEQYVPHCQSYFVRKAMFCQ